MCEHKMVILYDDLENAESCARRDYNVTFIEFGSFASVDAIEDFLKNHKKDLEGAVIAYHEPSVNGKRIAVHDRIATYSEKAFRFTGAHKKYRRLFQKFRAVQNNCNEDNLKKLWEEMTGYLVTIPPNQKGSGQGHKTSLDYLKKSTEELYASLLKAEKDIEDGKDITIENKEIDLVKGYLHAILDDTFNACMDKNKMNSDLIQDCYHWLGLLMYLVKEGRIPKEDNQG